MNVEPLNWKWVSLDVPLSLTSGTSKYVFIEPDGGQHAVAIQMMNRFSGNLDTACVFEASGSEKDYFRDEDCSETGRGAGPVKLTWELFDRDKLVVRDHFTTGDGAAFLGETPPMFMLGGYFPLRRGEQYALVTHVGSDLSFLAGARPHLVVQLMESGEGPLIAQAFEQIGAVILAVAGTLWAAIALFLFRKRQPRQ